VEFTLAFSGNLAAFTAAEARAAHGAVQSVVRRKTNLLDRRLERHIEPKLGRKLAKAGTRRVIQGRGVNTVGAVVSNALYKRPGGMVDLIAVFNEGAVVRPVLAKALFVGGRYFRAGGVQFATTARFAFKNMVRVPKLLDIEPIFDKTVADLDTQVVLEWDRRVEKIAASLGVAA
jgi:hypothetical protein